MEVRKISKIFVSSKFGTVEAIPLQIVNIHAVQPMADEENINNSQEAEPTNTLASAASVQDPDEDLKQ